MSFNLLEYYKALNGESTESSGAWHVNYNKRHAYNISSDFDAVDEHNKKINLPPSESKTELINMFSNKLGQKLKNTIITDNKDGIESIDLELEDRIVTIIMDQSGSMTWNDNNNFRHDVVIDLINKIEINYPGNITYNLIKYGADIINVLFFGIIESDDFDPNDVSSLSKMIKADDKANYDGMRIIRNEDNYPTSPIDGEIIDDGFISRIKDEGLVESKTYYYTIYTYDKNYKFSEGVRIKVTPQEKIIPRSIYNFRSVINSEDLTKGIPFIGTGVNRDSNTLGIWHMGEQEGKFLYDFSDTNAVFEYNKDKPIWYESRFVPAGISGLFFDGDIDAAEYEDTNNIYEINFNSSNKFTFMGWIYPYDLTNKQVIFGRSSNGEFNYSINISSDGYLSVEFISGEIDADSLTLEAYKWQHIAVVYNGDNPSGTQLTFYINRQSQSKNVLEETQIFSEEHTLSLGNLKQNNLPYRGKLTEISFHDTDRDLTYINSQIITSPIYDENNNQVDKEYVGIKSDNGDRLVVFKYDVPRDYDYIGGEVIVVRNEKHIPSWEEDGTVIYQVSDPGAGQFFISDSDDFMLGEKYYYRLFTKNTLNNISFLSDSPSREVTISLSSVDDYFLSLDSAIDTPESPNVGQLITAGNEKAYLRWKQNDIIDNRISRVKIFYSSLSFPVVNSNGGSNGQLVFTGLITDEKFIHRNIPNNTNAYYTIVNVDKYNRSSNYDSNGVQVEDFLHASTLPTSSANENTFPLIEIENVNYELIDKNTITIGWNQPKKSIENIEAYFDQTVYVYSSILDEFGDAISEDTPIKMSIASSISRETQADDVFSNTSTTIFEDIDAYDFFVARTNDGVLKGILKMTTNNAIISQIKEATFQIQLKALLPKQGGYVQPNDNTTSGDPISEYAGLIEQSIDDTESDISDAPITSSNNFYEYHSEIIQVHFTNPWEIELVSRDNQQVPQRCYCVKTNKLTGRESLYEEIESFNGIYIRATNPFVSRAKVTYKGLPIESGNIQIAVWDADGTELCKNACSESEDPPPPYEGPKLQPSTTVLPPDNYLPVIQGQEETYSGSGVYIDISYVDIPLYAPDNPQAVRLFVKGEKAGYSSIKDIYILFQNILQIDIDADTDNLTIDGKDITEFRANAFIINPDYPNYNITNSIDASLVTYPEDLSVVQWEIKFLQNLGQATDGGSRNIYSTDNVSLTNGTYSYTRNGTARNIFLGPISKGNKKIYENHEIKASIVYKGLSSFSKTFFIVGPYNPKEFDTTSAKFLMEIDGGWKGYLPNQSYGGGGYEPASSWPLWADGIHYKKIKISRNPRISIQGSGIDEFAYADCFRSCATQDNNEILELSSSQIVEILDLGKEFEILHGEIYEREDPYTGLHYLEVGADGFIDNGNAFVELNSEEISDVTYFYIRANTTVPNSGPVFNEFCQSTEINDCNCLSITDCDIPEWDPTIYISGNTTILLNNNPLVLAGGGNMSNGVPPCPICLNEPLYLGTIWKKVTNYYYSKEFGDPLNDFLYPIETFTDNNNFLGDDGETLIKHTSDVDIRVKVLWRGQNIPNDTPIYVSVGDNTASSLFVASQNVYYTTTDNNVNYSYVDISITARRYIESTITEQIEIFSIYDETKKTDRHIGKNFSLTLDKKNKDIDVPDLVVTDPSLGTIAAPPIITPFSATVDRYNIDTNHWDRIANMQEAKGNGFSGSVGNYIYYMGGLLGNDLNISDRNDKYNIANNEWSDVTAMPTARFGGMSITIGNNIYIIGGIFSDVETGDNLVITTLVEVYHTDNDTWETLTQMPTFNEGSAFEEKLGVAFGTASYIEINSKNYIYIIGGFKKAVITTDRFSIREYNQRILRYCVEDDIWEYSNILRSNELNTYERISPLSMIFDDKIIVFNGAILVNDEFIYPSEDFYINIEESFVEPVSGEWINFGSGFMGDFPVQKFQSAFVNTPGSFQIDEIQKLTASGGGILNHVFGTSVAIYGNYMVVGARETVYVFYNNINNNEWTEIQKLTASDGTGFSFFGANVAMIEDYIVIGAVGARAAYVFYNDPDNPSDLWIEIKKLTSRDSVGGDFFGGGVAIDGNYIVIGAYRANVEGMVNAGAAYVFYNDPNNPSNEWIEVQKLTASDGLTGDFLGKNVAINGDYIITGSPQAAIGDEIDAGAAYVFYHDSDNPSNEWTEVQKLTASDGLTNDNFGFGLAMDENHIVIGAYHTDRGSDSNVGAAYVFDIDEEKIGNWVEIKKLITNDHIVDDNFGYNVAVDGNYIAVGASGADIGDEVDTGAVYIFEINKGGINNWGQVQKLTASDGLANDYFGVSIGIEGDNIIIGASRADIGSEVNIGAAYLFEINLDNDYYILGGFNNNSPSLDILEKISTQVDNSIFEYQSSYNIINPSLDLTPLPTGKHGASAEFSNADGESFIYLMGGYTINKDDNYVDISFGI